MKGGIVIKRHHNRYNECTESQLDSIKLSVQSRTYKIEIDERNMISETEIFGCVYIMISSFPHYQNIRKFACTSFWNLSNSNGKSSAMSGTSS